MTIRKSIKNIYRPIGRSEHVTCNEMCSDMDPVLWNPHRLDHEIKSFNETASSLRLSRYRVQIDILNTPAVKIRDQDCILLSVEHVSSAQNTLVCLIIFKREHKQKDIIFY